VSAEAFAARDLLAAKRPNDALPILLRGLSAAPDDPELHCLSAQAHLMLNRPGEALKSATSAVASAPDEEWGHRLRSIALRQLGNMRGSVSAATEGVRVAPDLAVAHENLAEALLGVGNLEQAYAAAYEARRLDPNSANVYNIAGRCLLKQKKFADAEASFRYALQLEPDFAMAHNNLGVVLRAQGRRVEAVHAFNAAAKLDPTSEVARKNVYSGTRALVGGGFVVVLVITLLRLASAISLSQHLGLLSLVALGLVGLGIRWMIRNRPVSSSQVPSAAVAYYRSENRRLRPVQLMRIGSVVFAVVMMFVGIMLQSPLTLLLTVAVAGLLYVFSPRIWQRFANR